MHRNFDDGIGGAVIVSNAKLAILFFLIVSLYVVIRLTAVENATDYHDVQLAAVDKFEEAMTAIKNRKSELGIVIDPEFDPLESGMIGLPWPNLFDQSISTTRGLLEAKQLSTNPNFAALMVRYFKELRLTAGDYVAVNFSGSFPALNFAVLSAIEVMELNPIIASSIGASTYGANDPEFTYIDMERHVYESGIFSNLTTYVSLGGANDQLLEVEDQDFKQAFLTKYDTLGYTVINESDLDQNIIDRYHNYHDQAIAIKAFVNVGGNLVAFGRNTSYYQNGLIKRQSVSITKGSGLIERFLRDDIPVIELLNVEDLALKNDMSVTTTEPYSTGSGAIYQDISYPSFLIFTTIGLFVLFLGYNRYTGIHRRRSSGI